MINKLIGLLRSLTNRTSNNESTTEPPSGMLERMLELEKDLAEQMDSVNAMDQTIADNERMLRELLDLGHGDDPRVQALRRLIADDRTANLILKAMGRDTQASLNEFISELKEVGYVP